MENMKSSAQLRAMAKGRFANGEVITADKLARIAKEYDRLVEENAELREMLKRSKKAFLNQIELDLIRDSAKDETREIAESINKLLNK